MRRFLALVAATALTWFVVSGPAGPGAARPTALAVGFALIAAALAGSLVRRFGLPRVTGYLLFGVVCGPYAANIITAAMARELRLINGIAVVLIAFIAGLEINLARLRPQLRTTLRFGTATLLLLYAGLFAAAWLAWPWLGIAPALSGLQKIAAAGLLAAVVASFSPTVTIALIAESRASGPLSQMTLTLVILGDLILILMFALLMQFGRFAFGGVEDVGLFASVSWEIFGSFAFGGVAGGMFALYLRHVGRELTVALLAFCTLVATAGDTWQLEPLLAALAAGLVVENIAPPRGDMLKEALERGALPVLVVFFAAAGASLQMDALAVIGVVAVGVSAVRMFMIRGATTLAGRYAHVRPDLANRVWMGLVSQAGVTLGLTLIVASEFPTWGSQLQTLSLALIAIHELIGPVLFRSALARAGEVGRMDAPVVAPERRRSHDRREVQGGVGRT
jgi:Kef-type K+ transport system membrane component KefB